MRYDQAEAFAQGLGDDELCHCGRLRPYRLCCKRYVTSSKDIERRILGLTLQERTRLTVGAVREFLLGGSRSDLLSVEYFTTDRVARFYRYISDVWPHRMRPLDALEAVRDDRLLTGYFAGDPRPETVLQNLARVSLYTDRVLIPQPFYTPWQMAAEFDPVRHPEKVMQDTRRWAVMTLLLAPWIDAGMVIYVPDPADYDGRLREACLAAGKRRAAQGEIIIPPDDIAKHEEHFKQDFIRGLQGNSDEALVARARESIGLRDEQVESFLAEIHRQRDRDPFYLPGISGHGEHILRISSPVIEETLLTCGKTNAFPYTDMRGKWMEIAKHIQALPADAETWSPLSRAFLDCKLEFLDLVDAPLAFSVREDGYLQSFRDFMRDLWRAIDGSIDERAFSSVARDMADRLRHEHEIATSEWATIHRRYDVAVRGSAIGAAVAGLTSALATHGYIGIGISLVAHMLFSGNERRKLNSELANFRAKVPMSLFINVP